MKNIPAKNTRRIALIIAMIFGLNLTTYSGFAQDADASKKIQLLSEALFARDTGDLLLAREKVEKLISIAPNDKNAQALLISINQSYTINQSIKTSLNIRLVLKYSLLRNSC